MSTDQILIDELVTQLRQDVNFLKNHLEINRKHTFIGTKVTVLPNTDNIHHLSEPTTGILMCELSNNLSAIVMIIEDNVGKIIRPYLSDIRIPMLINYSPKLL